ncbi:hypothetical protein ACQPZX_34615 [Actinoplanes sp. CA-142083]|uniref:hypothetical protein n=1 Tax=Actinoplanes sp. CA-142083 TaxID=3239903 RepID=UPI003D9383B7
MHEPHRRRVVGAGLEQAERVQRFEALEAVDGVDGGGPGQQPQVDVAADQRGSQASSAASTSTPRPATTQNSSR